MNPWAQLTGDDNEPPSRAQALQAARMAFGDEAPAQGDGINHTISPLDFPMEAAALARLGVRGFANMGAKAINAYEGPGAAISARNSVAPAVTGYGTAIEQGPMYSRAQVSNVNRGAYPTVKDLAWNRDITQQSMRKNGILMHQVSAGNPKAAGSQWTGAWLREKYGSDDPKKIIEFVSREHGIPTPNLEIINDPGIYASYHPGKNTIYSNPWGFEKSVYKGVPDSNAELLGVLGGHESQHAIDHFKYPNFRSRQEFFGRGSGQIKDEELEQQLGFLSQLMKGKPGPPPGQWRSPERLARALEKGGTPEAINLVDPKFLGQVQDSVFNQSRFGDPLHFLQQQSSGHFKNWGSFEGEFIQKMMAQDALDAGRSVHPDFIKKWDLKPVPKKRIYKIER